jgi:signal transduction histidine kinase
MLFTMRPLVLETDGLVAALSQLAKKLMDDNRIEVIVEAEDHIEDRLEINAQGVLFNVIEEAWNNALKHAKGSHLWARLYSRGNEYVIAEAEDDGVGFDVESVLNSRYFERGSLGMVDMREQAELISATLHIESTRGRGTKISVLVPVGEETRPVAARSVRVVGSAKGAPQPSLLPSETRFAAHISSPPQQQEIEPEKPTTWTDLASEV